jgi:arylsulfatase A-like enzyme
VNLLDQVFGALLAEIDARGFRDQSLIAFTADHGEVMYRENAPFKWSHGLQLAPEALNVPLIVAAPDLPAGSYSGVTRSIDVFPTLAGLAGVPIAPKRGVQGVDLSPVLRGRAPPLELLGPSHTAVLASSVFKQMYEPRWQEVWSVARGFFPEVDANLMWVTLRDWDTVYKHKKVDGDHWGFQVFDLAKDPGETTNLYDPENPRHAEMVAALKAYKARLVEAYPQSGVRDRPQLLEGEEAELLRALGYIQ